MGLKPGGEEALHAGHPMQVDLGPPARGSDDMEEEKVMCDEAAGSGQLHIRSLTEPRPVITFGRRCLACIEWVAPVVRVLTHNFDLLFEALRADE